MKKVICFLSLICLAYGSTVSAQNDTIEWRVAGTPQKSTLVNFDDYEKLVSIVKEHRSNRLVSLDKFLEMSKKEDVMILDTRTDSLYLRKHIKGAKHLNFSNFTVDNLAKIIPNKNTKILIYCNNNFQGDPINLMTKSFVPSDKNQLPDAFQEKGEITLALNIPTYINLYGYGYREVYELSELVSISDPRLTFEGTDVD